MNTINNESATKKSKTQICSALMRLLKTKPYRKISVSQICSCAGISRTTFYKNFDSLDAVVLYKLTLIEKDYNKQYSADDDIRVHFVDLYTLIRKSRDFDLLFVKNNLLYIFEEQIRDGYFRYMNTQTGQNLVGFQREYMPEYLSATVVSLLRKWAETGYREQPEQMADITVRLIDGYQKLLPMPTVSEAYKKIQDSSGELLRNLESQADNVSDILNNVPVGLCVLFMPDDTHQEIWFANKQQMRLISPHTTAPETVSPKFSKLRSGYYKNAFSGVHPDDMQQAIKAFKEGFNQEQFKVPPIRLRIDDGNYKWIAMDVSLRKSSPEGRIYYAAYRDISREIQLRQELDIQRQQNAEKTLLDTIGHLPACSVLYREKEDGMLVPERYSEEFLSLMGYELDEGTDTEKDNLLFFIHPDDRKEAAKVLYSQQEYGSLQQAIFRIRIKKDSFKWVSVNVTRFSFLEERYLYVVFTDIDDLKKQEGMLKKQYDDAQAFLDSVTDTYLMTQRSNLTQNKVEALRGKAAPDASWEGEKYDELAERLLQEVKGDADRKNCTELLDRSYLLKNFEKGIRTVTREFRSHPAGYDVLWMQGVTTLSKHPESGDVISFFALSDILEKKLSEAIIHKIVAEQCDYVCCINTKKQQFEFFLANKRWQDKEDISIGSDYEDTLNSVFVKYVLPEEQEKYREFTKLSNVLASLADKESVSEWFHSREEGGVRVKQLEFSYLDRENDLLALVKTDITEAQQYQLEQEEKLRTALDTAETANAAKSDFLSSMSHDLRTPLNGVLGFTAFALKEDDPQKKQEYLKKIESSGQILLDLINDTLDLSRIESGKAVPEPEAVMSDDLIPAIVTALKPFAELKGVCLTEKLSDYHNQLVWIDRLKVNKIALNLISNAIKFTPSGGTVTVTPYCTLGCDEKNKCGFIIEDTGIGMSEEFIKHMYEPFAQEKRSEHVQMPGTGLGLSIVKRYVDLLDGSISVKSRLHAGTRWEVNLPVTLLGNGMKEKPKSVVTEVLSGKRVLLCEDNHMNTEIASMLLQEKGMLVETAENGALGLEKFSASADGYYDVILMDIRMPEMDGYESTRQIRALKRQDSQIIPIIAMTADAFEESIHVAKEVGMNAYITKPIEPLHMYAVLQQCMEKNQRH